MFPLHKALARASVKCNKLKSANLDLWNGALFLDCSRRKLIIEIPLLKDYEDNVRHDEGCKEAYEDAEKHSVPKTHPKPPRVRCNLCIKQGKSGLNKNGVGHLNRLDTSLKYFRISKAGIILPGSV